MEKLRDAYGKLYDSVAGTKWGDGLCVARKDAEYTTFTAMQGNSYFKSKTVDGKEFRFMLVGRAVNGWDEYRIRDEEYLTRENFIESSIMNLLNDKRSIIFGKDRFEWIDTNHVKVRNTARVGIDRGLVNGEYSLTRAQIWSYTKSIWDSLYGRETKWDERWFENIVWSNIYKIAPHNGDNPSDALQQKELEACKELLKQEIEYFKPTHIFLATAREYWFKRFEDIFECVEEKGTNISRGKDKNEDYVEAVGKYIYEDGSCANVVVACRPEGRTKDGYVNKVVKYLNE